MFKPVGKIEKVFDAAETGGPGPADLLTLWRPPKSRGSLLRSVRAAP
jgi:hypothetical protein